MCEQPLLIQADFILRRLAGMAQADPELRGRVPWKAAYERHYGWLGAVLVQHYAADDRDLPALASSVLAALDGISGEDLEAKAGTLLRTTQHLTLADGYFECACPPVLELFGDPKAHGFSTFIAR